MPKSKHRRKGRTRPRDVQVLAPGAVCPECGVTHESLMDDVQHALTTELCPKCGIGLEIEREAGFDEHGMRSVSFCCMACLWGGEGYGVY